MSSDDVSQRIVELSSLGDVEAIKSLIETESTASVNSADKDGMTALMHAAFKGRLEMCRYLLENGAEVNETFHVHEYTPLMFAVLSGSVEVTRLLLEFGASPRKKNDIGKTACQLAGFVGYQKCVTVICNFIPQSKLEQFTVIQGLDKEPKLPSHLLSAAHKFVTTINLNPVYLSLLLNENTELLAKHASVVYILEKLMELNVKELNEPLCFKMHYLTHVVQQASTHKGGPLGWIKWLLKGRESDGALLNLEDFVRTSIRDFRYRDSQLLSSLVKGISKVKLGDPPSALFCLEQAVNSSREVEPVDKCATCGVSESNLKRCSACKEVFYCSVRCQKLHWFSHKKQCKHKEKSK
ncbi:ankyrin repeat and MYND domain-containing protein 2-like [Corticium candelabrum]|uniref:ankyrin repeat and MYND domain-containing protein 2-like n=1 Tax=Corticium candelabrum TaxID=121492 RepID=UPI002E273316|nr:ankyrin repeat and MYND domain-containing protein 2-like [Corticium candelabrum]